MQAVCHPPVLSLVKTERDEVTVLKEEILDALYPDLTLRITENEQDLTFAYSVDGKSEKILADKVDARILSTDVAGGFVGNTPDHRAQKLFHIYPR